MKTKPGADYIPPEHVAAIRRLGERGMPVGRIAFLTHMSESTVREVLAAPVITTEESPAEGGAPRVDEGKEGA